MSSPTIRWNRWQDPPDLCDPNMTGMCLHGNLCAVPGAAHNLPWDGLRLTSCKPCPPRTRMNCSGQDGGQRRLMPKGCRTLHVSDQHHRQLVGSAFDTADPATPVWLEQFQNEWVDPTAFLDLRRPDWKATFKPLYVAGSWQRLWRDGKGRPRQGYFVRGDIFFKVGFYSDRMCVPCPAARVEILRRLHDSALDGHCGRHNTAARVQERYYWGGMWGDINHFVLSCLTCQRNRAVKRAAWAGAQVIGTPDFCWQHLHMDWTFAWTGFWSLTSTPRSRTKAF